MVQKRKLIEVALPLEAINRESAREKSIRHGHPSTLHLWWARRPLAAARAVLFAQIVDDPSSAPEEFPTEELQRKERDRLHKIIERLVAWENVQDQELFAEAHAEILKSTNGNPPPVHDPFAGGGTIPLEAQRLGLHAYASDLNPVAVLINKALIEIPQQFRDQPPVFSGLAESEIRSWKNAEGLAADVRSYGAWMRDEAAKRIGHLYPKAKLADGSEANVIAWVWARTVTCPNPACSISMPLVRTWWLGKKKGKEAYVRPKVIKDQTRTNGLRVEYTISNNPADGPLADKDGTVGRLGAKCLACETAVPLTYIRAEGKAKRLGSVLIACVAEAHRQRAYLAPDSYQIAAASVPQPDDAPEGELPDNPRNFNTPNYGLTSWADLFTNRQLTALGVFSDLVGVARDRAATDSGSAAYGDAIATYLAMAVSRMTDYQSTVSTWSNHPKNEIIVNTFGRQALRMTWDFGEGNPLGESSGSFLIMVRAISKVLEPLGRGPEAKVFQADAATVDLSGHLVATDPPYYDNIVYSDLSDYFYVWLRRALRNVYPDLFSTMAVPKAQELVANQYRHEGKSGAKKFFETGFKQIFSRMRSDAVLDYPITVYYAFRQSEATDAGEVSTGWQTLLDGLIQSGWEITATWPVRSEVTGKIDRDNSLASSIVLSLRPRPVAASPIDRRGFIAALEAELPDALRKLQLGAIAPVDLPQAAIGPGMAVFSRYSSVLEPDGTATSVKSALARINEVLDQVLNEQEGDFDATSRFAIAWYRQHGYGTGGFDDANSLANARNTTVDAMDRSGILSSRAGKVHLIKPVDLSADYDVFADPHTSNWEALHHAIKLLEGEGINPAGDFLRTALSRPDGAINADLVKELAHLLFRLAEANGWTKDALSFNRLVTSWPEIIDAARSETPTISQGSFDFEEDAD